MPISETHLIKYLQMSSDMPHLECDGMARVIAYEMKQDGYDPIIYWGIVEYKGSNKLHEWIRCEGQLIDFRLKMWFGNDAPHGIITDESVIYKSLNMLEIPRKLIIDILKQPFLFDI